MSSEQGNERLSPGLAGEVPGSWSVRQSGGEAGVGKGRFPSPSERGWGEGGQGNRNGLVQGAGGKAGVGGAWKHQPRSLREGPRWQGGGVAAAKSQKALFHFLVCSVRENLGSGNIFYFNIFF